MASKGLRVISCQVTRKLEAGNNLPHTIETLSGYYCVLPAGHIYVQTPQIFCGNIQ